jgi:hypothetical protein
LAITFLAPVNIIFNIVFCISRMVSTCFSSEPIDDIENFSLSQRLNDALSMLDGVLPSQQGLRIQYHNVGFFTPYQNFPDLFRGITCPIVKLILSTGFTLKLMGQSIFSVFRGLLYTAILKPQHMSHHYKQAGMYLSLAFGVALFCPVIVILEAMASITRLMCTWLSNESEAVPELQPQVVI